MSVVGSIGNTLLHTFHRRFQFSTPPKIELRTRFAQPVRPLYRSGFGRRMAGSLTSATDSKGSEGSPTVTLLHNLHADLGEAPTWDERVQRLYFVDINKQKIYSSSEDGSDIFEIDTHETVGTIALTTDKNILLAAMNRSVFPVDIAKREIGKAIATVPEDHGAHPPPEGFRFNDGKASPGGVFLVGRMHMKGDPGRFYRLHWKSRTEGYFEDLQGPDLVGLPNGLAWDNNTLYHADTYARTITAYNIDSDGVPIRHDPDKPIQGKVVVNIPEKDGMGPDGMAISSSSHLWVALPGSGSIGCYSPKTGKEVTKVDLPIKNPTCTTFGGKNLDQLYVTSMKEEGDEASENWGGVFRIQGTGESGYAPAYKVKIPDA